MSDKEIGRLCVRILPCVKNGKGISVVLGISSETGSTKFIGGGLEHDDEEPKCAAQRELREETGIFANYDKFEELGTFDEELDREDFGNGLSVGDTLRYWWYVMWVDESLVDAIFPADDIEEVMLVDLEEVEERLTYPSTKSSFRKNIIARIRDTNTPQASGVR